MQAALHEDPNYVLLICSSPADVVFGLRRLCRESSRLSDDLFSELMSNQRFLGCCGLDVRRPDRRQPDPRLGHLAAAHLDVDRDTNRGEIPYLALELVVGAARVTGRNRDPDLGDDLIWLQCGRVRVLEKTCNRDDALA